MKLTIIGCGDAFNSGLRHHSCYLLEGEFGRLLLECGGDAVLGLKNAGIALSSIDAILISHCHGDHFGGLPYFYLEKLFAERNAKPLVLFGPQDLEARFDTLVDALYPGLRQDPACAFTPVMAHSPFQWRSLGITPFEMKHNVAPGSPAFGYCLSYKQKRLAFSGDSGWCDNVIAAGKQADLYLIECSTYQPMFASHLDYVTLSTKFSDIDAKRYLLTHMGQDMLAAADKVDASKCVLVDEGFVVEI